MQHDVAMSFERRRRAMEWRQLRDAVGIRHRGLRQYSCYDAAEGLTERNSLEITTEEKNNNAATQYSKIGDNLTPL